jgi:hypothetical protein
MNAFDRAFIDRFVARGLSADLAGHMLCSVKASALESALKFYEAYRRAGGNPKAVLGRLAVAAAAKSRQAPK